MKNRLSTILTVIVVVVLVLGAVCIGSVKGYKDEREELLISCMAMHTEAGANLNRTIEKCRAEASDFDARLKHKLTGKIAAGFGVDPISNNVEALHTRLLSEQNTVVEVPDLLGQLGAQVSELLEDNIDTGISLGKVFWTVIFLMVIFGKKGRRKGFTFGKLFAGIGLFNMWRKK